MSVEEFRKLAKKQEELGVEIAALWKRAYHELEQPIREHKFFLGKSWAFDLAWRRLFVAIEGEGGIYQRKPSHSSIDGILRDIEKYNAAQMTGWKVLRISRASIDDGTYMHVFDWVAQRLVEKLCRYCKGQGCVSCDPRLLLPKEKE
jgi:hypothetical protein